MKKSLIYRLMMLVLLAVLVVACSPTASETKQVYTKVTDGKLTAGNAIPVPTNDVILTVSGKIGTTNVDNTIVMDKQTLESVGLVDYKVDDPFAKKPVTYRGVLMSTLLDVWQVDKDATILHVVALNDYAVDVPIADLRTYPVIFAMQADGVDMPIADKGPAMLVYPYNDFQFDQAVYNDYWAWQIKTIEVR